MKREKILKMCKILQRITFVIGILSIVLPVIFWSKIPEEIPSHYGASGVADNYSDKGILILLFFVTVLLMGMMSIAAYVVKTNATSKYAKETEKSQLDTVYPMLILMNFAIQCMFAYIIFCCAASRNLGSWFFIVMLIVVFVPLIYFPFRKKSKAEDPAGACGQYKIVEKQEEGIVYRSKVDWWLGLLLVGAMIYLIYLAIEPIVNGRGIQWVTMVTAIFVLVILVPLMNIKYVFYSNHLLVSCGIYGKERIAYEGIRNVNETKNPLSSAALSLDRIQIDYVEGKVHQMVLISPIRKKEFLSKLEQYRDYEEIR